MPLNARLVGEKAPVSKKRRIVESDAEDSPERTSIHPCSHIAINDGHPQAGPSKPLQPVAPKPAEPAPKDSKPATNSAFATKAKVAKAVAGDEPMDEDEAGAASSSADPDEGEDGRTLRLSISHHYFSRYDSTLNIDSSTRTYLFKTWFHAGIDQAVLKILGH